MSDEEPTFEDGGDDQLPEDIEHLVERMDPDPEVRRKIRRHLLAQRLVRSGFLRLDTGKLVRVGEYGDEDGDHG